MKIGQFFVGRQNRPIKSHDKIARLTSALVLYKLLQESATLYVTMQQKSQQQSLQQKSNMKSALQVKSVLKICA